MPKMKYYMGYYRVKIIPVYYYRMFLPMEYSHELLLLLLCRRKFTWAIVSIWIARLFSPKTRYTS